jgi:hypothetical protein
MKMARNLWQGKIGEMAAEAEILQKTHAMAKF